MRRARTFSKLLFLIFVAIVTSSGCQAGKTINEAKKIVGSAKDMHAEHLAPYHLTCAELYLFEARNQYDHSDFAAADTFAHKSLSFAKEAYGIAAEKRPMSANPSEPVFELTSIALSVTPKQDLKKSYGNAVMQLDSLKKNGLMECAPKELALLETHLVFFHEEWEERDYNKAYDHLRTVHRNMSRALLFMKTCRQKSGEKE